MLRNKQPHAAKAHRQSAHKPVLATTNTEQETQCIASQRQCKLAEKASPLQNFRKFALSTLSL